MPLGGRAGRQQAQPVELEVVGLAGHHLRQDDEERQHRRDGHGERCDSAADSIWLRRVTKTITTNASSGKQQDRAAR